MRSTVIPLSSDTAAASIVLNGQQSSQDEAFIPSEEVTRVVEELIPIEEIPFNTPIPYTFYRDSDGGVAVKSPRFPGRLVKVVTPAKLGSQVGENEDSTNVLSKDAHHFYWKFDDLDSFAHDGTDDSEMDDGEMDDGEMDDGDMDGDVIARKDTDKSRLNE